MMTMLKAWLVVARQYATLIAVVGVVLVVLLFARQQRLIGERNAMLRDTNRTLDSLALVLKADEKAKAEAAARARRDSVAVMNARRETARAVARTDVAVASAAEARDRALALAANAEATIPQLKAEIVELAARSETAEREFKAERASWMEERAKSGQAMVSLRGEVEAMKNENHDLRQLNDGLKTKVHLLDKGKPGVVQKYVVPAAAFAVGWFGKR